MNGRHSPEVLPPSEPPAAEWRRETLMEQGMPQPRSSSCRQVEQPDLWRPGRAHLAGIAGAGMRSLARVLLDIGWTLSGSDPRAESVAELRDRGVQLFANHAADNVAETVGLVIFSDAIGPGNPELQRAGERKIPTLRYFQALGLLSDARETIAVAGTHGKSTVTAMIGAILRAAGADPTLVFGAEPVGGDRAGPGGSRLGRGPAMVVEACEYRANFLHFRPREAVLLGIEHDHFDCYPTIGQLEHAFGLFARSVRADGRLLVPHACRRSRVAAASAACRWETFGWEEGADWRATGIGSRLGRYWFTVERARRPLCRVDLKVLGRHNVVNALAAAAVGLKTGANPAEVAEALSHWAGLKRRLEVVGQAGGVTWVDDYAHHPTEIAAALRAVREAFPERRVFCLFEPHQASRTARTLDEMAASLQNADVTLITEIFRAREPLPTNGEVTAADLARSVRALGAEVPPIHGADKCAEHLAHRLRPGDVLVTLGAGNIGTTGYELFERLRKNRPAG
jgi:UDP-N-acetylmuramate--alanine ligase